MSHRLLSHREKHKILLVIFPHTIIDPRAMMVHFPYAPLTDGAMMSPVRFYAAALRALKNYLTFSVTHPLDVLFGCITPRDRPLFLKKIQN